MKTINKYGISLRLVEETDAEFLTSLRTHPKLSTHISYTSPNISDQISWIQNYKIKEKQGLEFYYIAQNFDGTKYGTIRLYDFDRHSFELGSWIFFPNSPMGMAVKTHIIGLETGFALLEAEYCRITVRRKNISVRGYMEDFKPIITKEDDLDVYYLLTKENFLKHKEHLERFLSLQIG